MTYEEALNMMAKAEVRYYGEMTIADEIIELKNKCCEALEKQIENEKAIFTHICKSDNDRYPTEFSIYARVESQDDESVTIDRFQKFGALAVGKITISRRDFERYYKEVQE